MSGECVFDMVVADAQTEVPQAVGTAKRGGVPATRAPPPTASTFGIHGTSAVVGNAGGEFTEPSIHPARKPAGTFGRSVGAAVVPSNYLKKGEGPFTASRGASPMDNSRFVKSTHTHEKLKPEIPDRNSRPVMGMKKNKNYVLANAVESSMAVPTKNIPPPQPLPTQREDFGRVPEYLKEVKSEIAQRREAMKRFQTQVRDLNERWSELSADELTELRDGLRQRWEMVNRVYQSKGFSKLETPSQKAHQEQLEKELRALEFAMQKLGRAHVFVYDDQK